MNDTPESISVALFWARLGQMNDDVTTHRVIARLYYVGHDAIARATQGLS